MDADADGQQATTASGTQCEGCLDYHFARGLAYFKEGTGRVCLVGCRPYLQLVVAVRLQAVGHLYASHAAAPYGVGVEAVQHQFNVTYGVDVPVDVEITVGRLVRGHQLRLLHTHAGHGGNGWRGAGHQDVGKTTLGQLCEVGRQARFGVDKGPDARGVSVGRAVGAQHAEVAVGELAVEFVYPSAYAERLAAARTFVDVDDKARKNPHMVALNHILVAKAMKPSVHGGATQHDVAQVAPRNATRHILGEGLYTVIKIAVGSHNIACGTAAVCTAHAANYAFLGV